MLPPCAKYQDFSTSKGSDKIIMKYNMIITTINVIMVIYLTNTEKH